MVIFSLPAHQKAMEQNRLARQPETPEFLMTPNGPDRNAIWTTYHAFLNGEIKFPLPWGYWPNRGLYEPSFIGPLPPSNRWWISWEKRDHRCTNWYFLNDHIPPDAADVVDWIRSNIMTRIQLNYSWFDKGRRNPRWSKLFTYDPEGDKRANDRFARMVKTSFGWLHSGEARSVYFHFTDACEGGAFKTRYPWR